MATTYHVSPAGQDSNPGTEAQPFLHVQCGVDALSDPGDVLRIHGGTYVESVVVDGKVGGDQAGQEIVIESYDDDDDEQAVIDSGYDDRDAGAVRFREAFNGLWHLVDPGIGEYASHLTFQWNHRNTFDRGAFTDFPQYTRLIRYSNVNDLRSVNQTFGRLPQSLAPAGPFLVDDDDAFIIIPDHRPHAGERVNRPWVYMGPGIFHSPDDSRIHIRLAPTTNGISGLADYAGDTDPNNLGISLSRASTGTLTVRNCQRLVVRNITVRFGADTIRVQSSRNVQFDHVRIYAGAKGVELGTEQTGSTGTIFSHCQFDGGIPTWFFRSDEKGGYRFKVEGQPAETNNLASGTSGLLFAGAGAASDNTEIHHCEFVHGHDLQLVGKQFRFHHNWVDDMQDDALAIGFGQNSGEVHHNVVTRCQTAMSFASDVVGGPYRIYRNLFDLRRPISAIRTRPVGDLDGLVSPFRFGQFYKGSDHADDGVIDLFQNTFLMRFQEGVTSVQYFRHSTPLGPRRSFNNIFVDIEPQPLTMARVTAYLPTFVPGSWPTDGNCYFRVGTFFEQDNPERTGVLRHDTFMFDNHQFDRQTYPSLENFRTAPPTVDPNNPNPPQASYYVQSKTLYGPGYENSSIDVDPQFLVFDPTGEPTGADDLRLGPNSLARQGGIVLNDPLLLDPPIHDPQAPTTGDPDMGCYPSDNQPLQVGVDGRRGFPA